mgnify:CR=1 FL=1
MKKKTLSTIALSGLLLFTGCSASSVASQNISTASDNFEVPRRIVFFNGITDTYLLTIEGLCSINADGEDGQLEVTCAVAEDEYKKHYLGLSDNVTYFVEQLDSVSVDSYHYRVMFRPETIIPDIDLDTSLGK